MLGFYPIADAPISSLPVFYDGVVAGMRVTACADYQPGVTSDGELQPGVVASGELP